MVIKPEDRQLLANFVKNLTNQQRREMLNKLLKTSSKRILNDEEMEKFREQLRADLRWCRVCGMTWHLLPHPTAKTDSAKLCVIRLR